MFLFKNLWALQDACGLELVFIHPHSTALTPGVGALVEVDAGGVVNLSKAVLSCAVELETDLMLTGGKSVFFEGLGGEDDIT